MGKEIERKYLVDPSVWRPKDSGVRMRQGYLNSAKERTVRVRLAGERAFLTVKGPNDGIVRAEFEYEVPVADAKELLDLCEQPLIEKIRYCESFGQRLWEIDCFFGANEGLLMAEVELEREDEQPQLPKWAGEEVSDDPRYYNANLIAHPYGTWGKTL